MNDIELLEKAINILKKKEKQLTPHVRKELLKVIESPKTRKRRLIPTNKTRCLKVKQKKTRRIHVKNKKNHTRKIKY